MEERKITLVDDEQTLEFYVLEETKLNGSDYLLVTDAEDEEEEADCYILKDMSREGEADALYEFVEDEAELEGLMKIFEELLDDVNEEKVKDLLREKGLKVTSQRLMVLNILSAHGDEHLTVEEIYDLAKEESPEIGLATIYRTVQVLLELHVIEKVTFDDGFARYELNGEETGSGHRHHHAICTQCGKVYSLETDLLDTLEKQVFESLGFEVTDHEVKLYGLCSACRRKAQNAMEVKT